MIRSHKAQVGEQSPFFISYIGQMKQEWFEKLRTFVNSTQYASFDMCTVMMQEIAGVEEEEAEKLVSDFIFGK